MRDRETGRSRGFGFVTFGTSGEADNAIQNMNEQELDGRRIKVNIANARGCKSDFQRLSDADLFRPQQEVVVEATAEEAAMEAEEEETTVVVVATSRGATAEEGTVAVVATNRVGMEEEEGTEVRFSSLAIFRVGPDTICTRIPSRISGLRVLSLS